MQRQLGFVLCLCHLIVFVLLLGLLGAFGCGPGAPAVEPCRSCQGSCPEGFWCAHGFCLTQAADLPRCTLPEGATVQHRPGSPKVKIDGCQKGEVVDCVDPKTPCHIGKARCINGYWGTCQELQPLDGLKQPCSLGKGACQADGVWVCELSSDAKGSLRCDAVVGAPQEERCNGKDDDCDGQVDEELVESCFTGPVGARGVGACVTGTQKCISGTWSLCEGEVLPSEESCNGKDDDCDGQIDEDLTRSCYDGPDGTAGKGLCRAGQETCSQGQWGACEGMVKPAKGQSCQPVLVHTIETSLLGCQASAQARECDVGGACLSKGSEKQDESRKGDMNLSVRCRGSYVGSCGVFSSEGVTRREVQALTKFQDGAFSLTLFGFAGSCACNGWCQSGCSGMSGCCLTCDIASRECNAAANYFAVHKLTWKEPLPTSYSVVLEVVKADGTLPRISVMVKGSPQSLTLQQGKRCSLALGADGLSLQISSQSNKSCSDSQSTDFVLQVLPLQPKQQLPAPCLP